MNTLSNIIPNPLLINNTLNSDYALSKFATSDFDGKENTAVLRKYDNNIIPNRLNDNMYVGSIGELGLIMENISYINNILKEHNGNEICLDGKYASSTFYNVTNIKSKEYNIGTNVNDVWYYDTYKGMIGKDKITNTFYSLPIYKFNIADFETNNDIYKFESNVNYMKIDKKTFDFTSYLIYCQDDTLDDLENTLTTYYFEHVQQQVLEDQYSIINNHNEAFAQSTYKYTIAHNSQIFSYSGDTTYFIKKNIRNEYNNSLYLKSSSGTYIPINIIINNNFRFNTKVYLDYDNVNDINTGATHNISINYKYNGETLNIKRDNVEIIGKSDNYDEYLNRKFSNKSSDRLLICTDTDVNSFKVHFIKNNDPQKPLQIINPTKTIAEYEEDYNISRIDIDSRIQLIKVNNENEDPKYLLPYELRYIVNTNENLFEWKTLDSNQILYSFSNSGILIINENNQFEVIQNGNTTITAKFTGGYLNIDNNLKYFQSFEVSFDVNIELEENQIRESNEYFCKINYNNSTPFISELVKKDEYDVNIDTNNHDSYAFIISTNDNNNGIYAINLNETNNYTFNGIENILSGVYKCYDNNELIGFYSFVKSNNSIVGLKYFSKVEGQENTYIINDIDIDIDYNQVISKLTENFIEFTIKDRSGEQSNEIIQNIKFTNFHILRINGNPMLVFPFDIILNYKSDEPIEGFKEYNNGSALIEANYKYVFPSEEYQYNKVLLGANVIHGSYLYSFKYLYNNLSINTNDRVITINSVNDDLPIIFKNNQTLNKYFEYSIDICEFSDAVTYQVIDDDLVDNKCAVIDENGKITLLENTPENIKLKIKASFNKNRENIEYESKEISYWLIIDAIELYRLEIEYTPNSDGDIVIYGNEQIIYSAPKLRMKKKSSPLVFGAGNTNIKTAQFEYIEYDFSYYIYFTYNNQNYLLETNNPDIINSNQTIVTVNIDDSNTKNPYIDFKISKDFNYNNVIQLEKTANNYNIYIKSKKGISIADIKTTPINKENIIKYPIYQYNHIYSMPLLPSRKIDNYYDCEFFIILPTFNINKDDIKKQYTVDNIYNNIRIILIFGDGEIKETLKPYKKLNDSVLYKFRKLGLFDYTYIQNQELKIMIVDLGKSVENYQDRIIFAQKIFFNIFKLNLYQGKYQNIDFKVKYNNYFPLKYPLKNSKLRYLNINYIPLENLSNYDPNKINHNVTLSKDNVGDLKIDLDNIAFNYSYLNSYIYKNISETTNMLSWFLEKDGNGLNVGIDNNFNSYSYLSLSLQNVIENKYSLNKLNIYVKNYTYYDEFGILSGKNDTLNIKRINHEYKYKSDKDKNNKFIEESYNNDFCIYGMKEVLYVPYNFDINTIYGSGFDFSNIDKVSIFEDILYIYNNSNEDIYIYFTDESKILCESTRKILMHSHEMRTYYPSRHTEYNIIIKTHDIDNNRIRYNDFDFNNCLRYVNNIFSYINDIINSSLSLECEDIVSIHIYDYSKPAYGHIVILEKK